MYKVDWKFKPFLFTIDTIGSILFFWTKLKPKPKKINKILIIKLDHIGDMVLSTSLFQSIKSGFPNAELHVLCRSLTKTVIQHNPNINKIIEFNPFWFSRKDFEGWKSFLKKIKNLRKEKYNVILEIHTDPRNILLAFLIGSYRIGYGIRGLKFLLNKVVKFKKTHITEEMLNIARTINPELKLSPTELFLSKKELDEGTELTKHIKKKIICLTPGTGRINKYWFNEYWAELADKLIEKYNAHIVFSGTNADLKDIEEITSKMKHREHTNLAGKTTLLGLGAVLKKCSLFIGTDTGPLHFAKAVNIPTIALYGPVNPKIWGYNDKTSKSLYKFHNCSFCDKPTCNKKTNKMICMKSIMPSDILNTVKELNVLK